MSRLRIFKANVKKIDQMLSCSGITWRRDWKEKMSLWSSGWPFIIWLNRFTRPDIRLGMAWFRDQGLWLQICYGFPIISSSCSLSSEVFALIVTLHCFVPSSCIVFTVHQSFVSVWLYCWSLNGGSASQVSKSNVVRRVVWSPLT